MQFLHRFFSTNIYEIEYEQKIDHGPACLADASFYRL